MTSMAEKYVNMEKEEFAYAYLEGLETQGMNPDDQMVWYFEDGSELYGDPITQKLLFARDGRCCIIQPTSRATQDMKDRDESGIEEYKRKEWQARVAAIVDAPDPEENNWLSMMAALPNRHGQ